MRFLNTMGCDDIQKTLFVSGFNGTEKKIMDRTSPEKAVPKLDARQNENPEPDHLSGAPGFEKSFELDGGDGLFTGKPVNRKNGSIQDCIHSCSLIKQLIDRNLKTKHCRNGLKPVPLSVPLETARIMKTAMTVRERRGM